MALSWQEEKAVVIGPIFHVEASIPFSGLNKSIQRELAITLGTSPPSLMNNPCAKFNSTRTELKLVGKDQSYTRILNEPRYNLKKDCGSDLQSITATAFQDEHDQFGNLILHIFAIFSFPKGQNWIGQVAVNMTGDPKSFIVQKPCANGARKRQIKFFNKRA
ncbi:hypothetical protein RvY_12168-2 [Ramazzottius varieornatus]|nr:hypothetical protein RvY_12168-2 [Ramazzottius varieornatus]